MPVFTSTMCMPVFTSTMCMPVCVYEHNVHACVCLRAQCACLCVFTSTMCMPVCVYEHNVHACVCLRAQCACLCVFTSTMCMPVFTSTMCMPVCVYEHNVLPCAVMAYSLAATIEPSTSGLIAMSSPLKVYAQIMSLYLLKLENHLFVCQSAGNEQTPRQPLYYKGSYNGWCSVWNTSVCPTGLVPCNAVLYY